MQLTPKQLVGKIPWIKTRGITPGRCEALTSGSPGKAYRARERIVRSAAEPGDFQLVEKHTCKMAGKYVYHTHNNNPFWERPRRVCWSHLVHHHLLGSMYEAERLNRWLRRHPEYIVVVRRG